MISGWGEVREDAILPQVEITERALTAALNDDSLAGQTGTDYSVLARRLALHRSGYLVTVSRKVNGLQKISTYLVTFTGRVSETNIIL
jgi:hypothetical protein